MVDAPEASLAFSGGEKAIKEFAANSADIPGGVDQDNSLGAFPVLWPGLERLDRSRDFRKRQSTTLYCAESEGLRSKEFLDWPHFSPDSYFQGVDSRLFVLRPDR